MNILSVHFDSPCIRTCLLRKKRKGVEIRALRTVCNPEDVKQLYIENFKGRIVSGLSAKDFLIRSMDAKIPGGRHIEEALTFQAEALSHFKPEEILTLPVVDKGRQEALVFTVLRERFKEHLNTLKELKMDPDAVSTVPSALCHFVRWKFPELKEAFIVDLGSNEITCASLENGELKKSHAIGKGVEGLLNALYEDRKRTLLKKETEGTAKQIDLLLLKAGLNPHLSSELNEIRQELARIYYSFNRDAQKPILFTGRVDAFIHFREYLFDCSEGEWTLSPEEQKFAVSIGLGLEQTAPHPLQLRRGEFFPQKNWARMGLYALLLLGSSLLLSGALLALGTHSQNASKERMLESLQTTSIQQFFADGRMEEEIDKWIAAIETNTQEYPYILQAPKATEVLAWLSSHPLLKELKEEGDPIDLKEFKYQLVSFPTLHSDKERFSAKVELEFNFKSLMNARKFHEALREGDDWVDPKLEVSWDALNQGYRTSFFMKNRSPHVP